MVESLSPPVEEIAPQANAPRWHFDRSFWKFFAAAFFFDAGFALYFFLFNLYLADLHYSERAIGSVNAAFTVGSLLGTLPAGEFTRRWGIRPLLLLCFSAAPLLGIARALCPGLTQQISLAFLMGLAMSCWGVCFLPAVARLTTPSTRSSAFSLIFAVSVGTSALGGFLCGELPGWIASGGLVLSAADVKRLLLVASCCVSALGVSALLPLRIPSPEHAVSPGAAPELAGWKETWRLDKFLAGLIPCMALWAGILAVTGTFASVYLSRQFQVPLRSLSWIFSCAQILQLGATLLMPRMIVTLGRKNAITLVQAAAAAALLALGLTHAASVAIWLYLALSVAQWMSSPVLYDLLMHVTPDSHRSTVAAMTMFGNGVSGAVATALSGILLSRFGYGVVLPLLSIAAIVIAVVFRRINRDTEAAPMVEAA